MTNNIAEYEVVLSGLRKVRALGVARVIIQTDSQIVTDHINKDFQFRHPDMITYLEAIRKAEANFRGVSIRSIPRTDNNQADTLAKAIATGKNPPIGTFLKTLHQPTARTLDETTVAILPIQTVNWRDPSYRS